MNKDKPSQDKPGNEHPYRAAWADAFRRVQREKTRVALERIADALERLAS